MARARGAASFVLSSMMEWGLRIRLGKDELKNMRIVCWELRQACDLLALRLDSEVCKDPTSAKRIAMFHRRLQAAQQLQLKLSYQATRCDVDAFSCFMAAYVKHYTAGNSAVSAVRRCHIRTTGLGRVQAAPVVSLLSTLPALEALIVRCDSPQPCSVAITHPRMLSALVACKHLHTLALDAGAPCTRPLH